ncbi:hypothetical protein U1Q18_037983 [Sarracenia purpurea var. burkii]
MFEHLKSCSDVGRLIKVFETLLQSFQITVLSAYKSKFSQAVIKKKYDQDATNVGDEGGFAPNIQAATEFAISLIQTLLINDSRVISELHNLVDALAKLAERPGSPESLQQLVEVARNYATNAVAFSAVSMGKEDNIRQAREKKAPGPSAASKEDYNVMESVEPDPAGFRK